MYVCTCIMYYLGAHLDLAAGGDREYICMYGTVETLIINTMKVDGSFNVHEGSGLSVK